MNIYDRIINMLLEARIEEYIERLDEAAPMSRSARVEKIAGKMGRSSSSRAKQLMKGEPVTKAMGTIKGSKGKRAPHTVSTGMGRTKTGSHVTMPTSKMKRAVSTVVKHG